MLLLFLAMLSTASDASFVFVRKREIWLVSSHHRKVCYSYEFLIAERSKKRNKNRQISTINNHISSHLHRYNNRIRERESKFKQSIYTHTRARIHKVQKWFLNEVKEEVKEENGCESFESRTGKRRSESESPRAREASKWVTREQLLYY